MTIGASQLNISSAMPLLQRVIAVHEYADLQQKTPANGAMALIDCAISPPVSFVNRFMDSRKPECESSILRTHALRRALPLVQSSNFGSETAAQTVPKMLQLLHEAQWQIEFSPLKVPSAWPQADPRFVADDVIDLNLPLRSAYRDVLEAVKRKNGKAFSDPGHRVSPQKILNSLSHYPVGRSSHPTRANLIANANSSLPSLRATRILFAAAATCCLLYLGITAKTSPEEALGYGGAILGGGITVYKIAEEALGAYHRHHYVSRGPSLVEELQTQGAELLLGLDPRGRGSRLDI